MRRFGERSHGVGRKLTGGGQRGVARVGPFKPGLRRGAIGRLQRLQFPPRLVEIISQRSRSDPRHHGAAIIAGGIGAFDLDQFRRARLQTLDDAAYRLCFQVGTLDLPGRRLATKVLKAKGYRVLGC